MKSHGGPVHGSPETKLCTNWSNELRVLALVTEFFEIRDLCPAIGKRNQ